jgi:very-short-patch-repair endonuclease
MIEPREPVQQSGSSPSKGEDRRGLAPKAVFSHTRARTARARKLRATMTDAERKLWSVLRGAQMNGHSFRRQHPIGNYVADFWCADARLVVEVDGGQHNLSRELVRDARRSEILAQQGIKVIRFWNNDVLLNLDGVWQVIAAEISVRVASTPTPTLPLAGGGSDGAEASLADASSLSRGPQSGSSPSKGEDRRGLASDVQEAYLG